MPQNDIIKLIKLIEDKRKTRVLCYITGDRPNLSTVIADDAVRILYSHLETIGHCNNIDLFLYSRGGHTLPPYRMVRLIREYCEKFSVLVPYRAHSAATLICLGADNIVMGKLGELSPVDPTTANAFNPQDPTNPQARIPISVEDVVSYLSLAREKASLTDADKLAEVFRALSDKVHPVALGNIHRTHTLIRLLTRNLLSLHMDSEKEKGKIDHIVEVLTEKLYSHDYMISREEAKKELALKIEKPNSELESLMWTLYEAYEKKLCLREPFNPATLLGDKSSIDFFYEGAIIESIPRCDAFIFEGTITRAPRPPPPFLVNFKLQEWRQTR